MNWWSRESTHLGRRLPVAKFCIHHFGQLAEEETRSEKAAAYRDLLRMKVRDSPDDAMAWIQLGLQEYECSRQTSEPLRCFEHALLLEPKATAASLFKGMVYLDLGKYDQALEALDAARADKRSRALCEQFRGDAFHNLGRLLEARTAYTEAGRLTGGDPVLSSKLGYTEVRLGRTQDGINRLKQSAESAPEIAEIRERLMKAYVAVNALAPAGDEAEKLASLEGTAKAYLRAASLRVHAKQLSQAKSILEKGMALFPGSAELRLAFSELGGDIRAQFQAASSAI